MLRGILDILFLLRYYRPICVTRRILVTDRMSVCSTVPCPNVPPFHVGTFQFSLSVCFTVPYPNVPPFHTRMFHCSMSECSAVPCPVRCEINRSARTTVLWNEPCTELYHGPHSAAGKCCVTACGLVCLY